MLVVPQFRGLTERGLTEFLAALARTDSPAHQKETWDQLTERQKNAARRLGYDSPSWDDGDAPPAIRDRAHKSTAERGAHVGLHTAELECGEGPRCLNETGFKAG